MGLEDYSLEYRWNQVPNDLRKWFYLDNCGVCWNGEALLTLTGGKMDNLRKHMQDEYHINVIIEADTIYRILDRIYDLEKRLKKLEIKQL